MNQNQSPVTYANSPVQWYDYALSMAMELAWGNPENVYEIYSVRMSNPEYFNGGVTT